jgi:hypothetical protein
MNKKIEKLILSKTQSSKIVRTELIQELWSGYGHLSRIHLDKSCVILKLIKFPAVQKHPRGWNSETSHSRKIKSYQIEMNWYQKRNREILNAYYPQYMASGEVDGVGYLLLEDLQEKSFRPYAQITWEQVKRCLSWLARFHIEHLNSPTKDLWDIGTYWHLGTRADELAAMDDKQLKDAAASIDKKLNDAKYKSIVHGDAKLANFLFNDTAVSAVDFQYVGGGVGIKDIAYFLSSIYNEDELSGNEVRCLDYYFKEINNIEVEKEWRELYPYACCDFYRFLQGWSPNHPKINTYSQEMTKKVLACL